jgi:hypothetical protein
MSQEFLREVDEEYRRDRAAEFWKRWNGVIVGLAVLVVAAVGGWRYWQHSEVQRAETAAARFDDAVRLARDGKGAESEQALDALAREAPDGYRMLARFRAAAETGKREAQAGAKAYDALADDTAVDGALRDLARLRAAMLRLDAPDPAPALTSLQGLAAPTNPWRHTAREMLGLSAMKRADFEGATRWFDQIAADRETPQGLRQRLEIYAALAAGGPVQVTQ